MKKIIKFITGLIIIFTLWLFSEEIYLYVRTGCEIKWGAAGIYSDYAVCNGKYIADGVIDYKVIGGKLLIFSVEIEDRFPRLCFTTNKLIYLYSPKERKYKFLSEIEVLDINKKYKINDAFYTLPEQYIQKYANNCKN
ncbi:hypothetical protein [Avibacterium paragallinarum]|uniref:Uncharacterized protein n=1 Tax=Avibacterium paragallinarum TaxID=728 RepID=A0ABU7QT40_AVIPA|nr:hypothetical protein [Avibacterium paragallinarum]